MRILMMALCMLGIAVTARANFNRTEWNWQRPIEVRDVSGFVRLPIPPEVFNESQPSLNDLRVVGEDNSLVPHLIHWGRIHEIRDLEWKSARLMNATFVPEKYSRITVDFGEAVDKNLIKVGLSGRNYRRRALLEGGSDCRSWEVVKEDLWLFDVNVEGTSFKVDTLRFPSNNFRYLRLTVFHMADDPRRIHIETVEGASLRSVLEKELLQVPVKMRVTPRENEKQSIVELDLEFRNLPVASLQLEVPNSYFYRAYELQGRREIKERVPRKTETGSDLVEREAPWRFVHRGVFYRSRHRDKVTESLRIDGLNAPYRYLRLRIFNGDNPPLQISHASICRRETSLIFQVQKDKSYMLFGGNPEVGGADYDLGKAVQGLDELTLPLVRLGSPVLIGPKEALPPWTERYSTVIWIVLAIAVGVMVGFIVRNLKKLPTSQEPL